MLSERLAAALRVDDGAGSRLGRGVPPWEDDGETVVVRVDSVERRYRDAIKAGAEPVEGPRDEVGLGAWRRVARLVDRETGRRVTIWSDKT